MFSVNYKESRPRNLGRGVSKPKKNTVASLLAQSRAVGVKPMLSTQQLLSQGADLVRKHFWDIFCPEQFPKLIEIRIF